MNWNTWIRQFHRWVSLAFTAAVIANFAVLFALGREHPAGVWVGFSALLPLALLLFSGLYLYALPYIGKRRSLGRAD